MLAGLFGLPLQRRLSTVGCCHGHAVGQPSASGAVGLLQVFGEVLVVAEMNQQMPVRVLRQILVA